jgi:AraC-like DNA-binding protein
MAMTTQIRAGVLSNISSTIEQLGGNPDTVFKAVGFDPQVISITDALIPFSQYRQLLAKAAEVTDCERFGLLMSESLGPQSLGVVGVSMQPSRDVGTAFELLAKFLHLHDQHGTVTLEPLGNYSRIGYLMDDLAAPGAAQVIDVSAALGHNLLKTLIGFDVPAVRYEFPYPEPADLSAYQVLNTKELVFDTESFGFLVDRKYLEIQIPNSNPHLAKLLREYMQGLEVRAGKRMGDKVELIVKDLLSSGECTLEAVAVLFNITPRTLQNKLRSEDTCFHDIVEQVRKTMALHYLKNSAMDLTNIALLIGYSDSSAFSRSFRRWYNIAPSQWRKSEQAACDDALEVSNLSSQAVTTTSLKA